MNEASQGLDLGAFKHVVVPIGVIIGLGVARIVMSVSQYIQQRERVRFSAVHALWSGLLFVLFLGAWWILWGLSHAQAERWSFFAMIYLVVGPALIYLPSILLLPEVPEEGSLDLGALLDGFARTMLLSVVAFVVWLVGAEMYLLREPFWIPKRTTHIVVAGALLVGAAFPSRRMTGIVGSVALVAVLVSLATVRARLS